MEKFAIMEVVDGFPLGGLNIGQRRAPEEVGATQADRRHNQHDSQAPRHCQSPHGVAPSLY